MKILFVILLLFPLLSCISQVDNTEINEKSIIDTTKNNKDSLRVCAFYEQNKGDQTKSKQIGTVANGSLINGKLFPFYGANFTYFDKNSYLGSRAFTSNIIRDIVLHSYNQLSIEIPSRHFYLMELSNEHGGKIFPHKTHQNGLSVDFMMPMLKSGIDYYGLDTLGADHYWLSFNDNGQYDKDTTVSVDFNVIAQHILILQENAKKVGYQISKVIIKIEYKDELFGCEYGEKLKKSGIYVVKSLTPLINNIHDDHYHIDFEKIN